MISPTQKPLHDNKQYAHESDFNDPGRFRTRNPSRQEAADKRLSSRCHRNRHQNKYTYIIVISELNGCYLCLLVDRRCGSFYLLLWLHARRQEIGVRTDSVFALCTSSLLLSLQVRKLSYLPTSSAGNTSTPPYVFMAWCVAV